MQDAECKRMECWKRARKPPPRKKCGKSGFARLPFFAALPARALASAGQMQSGTGGATDAEGRCNRLRPFMSQNPRFLATKPRSGTACERSPQKGNLRPGIFLTRSPCVCRTEGKIAPIRARTRFRGQKRAVWPHETERHAERRPQVRCLAKSQAAKTVQGGERESQKAPRPFHQQRGKRTPRSRAQGRAIRRSARPLRRCADASRAETPRAQTLLLRTQTRFRGARARIRIAPRRAPSRTRPRRTPAPKARSRLHVEAAFHRVPLGERSGVSGRKMVRREEVHVAVYTSPFEATVRSMSGCSPDARTASHVAAISSSVMRNGGFFKLDAASGRG